MTTSVLFTDAASGPAASSFPAAACDRGRRTTRGIASAIVPFALVGNPFGGRAGVAEPGSVASSGNRFAGTTHEP